MSETGNCVLEVRNLKVWYPAGKGFLRRARGVVKAVDGVGFSIRRGETLGVVGESGSGKSTIARAIFGLVKPTAGEIKLRGRAAMVFQDPLGSLNPRMTVMDIITEAMVYHGIVRSAEKREAALRLLAEVGMGEDALNRYPHEFSGGQRQRISIARALSLNPSFIHSSFASTSAVMAMTLSDWKRCSVRSS